MIKKITLLLISLLSVAGALAQDIHFTQFNVNPMLLNPALVGFFNCDYRLTAQYRNQWGAITVPYRTFAGSAEMRFMKGREHHDMLGFGLLANNDLSGDSKLSQTQLGLDVAYSKSLDRFSTQYFSFGAQVNYNALSLDRSGVYFDDQFNMSTGNLSGSSAEQFAASTHFTDVSAGLQYSYTPDLNHNFSAGLALFHINQPYRTFRGDYASLLKRKTVFNLSGQARLSEKTELFPKIQISMQDPHREVVIGSFLRMDLDKKIKSRYGIYYGAWYRVGDMLSPVVRVDLENLSLGFSYDFNLSSLTSLSFARGGPELSLIYVGCIPSFRKVKTYCPRF